MAAASMPKKLSRGRKPSTQIGALGWPQLHRLCPSCYRGDPMLYRWLRPLLYFLPAEVAHRLVARTLRFLQAIPGIRTVLRWVFGVPRGLETRALGLTFPSPIGLAAGFDKDAEMVPALLSLGFGFIEVGTVTGEPQPGNPRPRLFRLVRDRALVNRMGFNNSGAARVSAHIARLARRPGEVLGVNIGKTKVVPSELAAADYEKSAMLLGPLADYLVVNVSSPNTPGLRDLQAVSALRPILQAVQAALARSVPGKKVPLLVKIAPDLGDEDVDAVADLALELGLDGIVATNTTISRAGLQSHPAEVERCGAGGLSGPPVRERSLAILRRLHARVGTRLTLVSVGGIESVSDVWERLAAGARLVQVYSALVYAGPGLPGKLAKQLAERLRAAGLDGVEALIGSASGAAGSDPRTQAL